MLSPFFSLVISAASLGEADIAPGSTHRIIPENSIVAFITYKAGFAAALVDNNLVYPSQYSTYFVHGAKPEDVRFSMRIATSSLVVNEFPTQRRWFPRLQALGILDTPFKQASESRRNKIRKSIVAEKMLDAAGHPFIDAKTRYVRKRPNSDDDTAYVVGLDVTIRGTTAAVEWPATIVYAVEKIDIETHGELKFSTFGIDAFSTLFGAVRYRDDLHVYARLVAEPIPPPPPPAKL